MQFKALYKIFIAILYLKTSFAILQVRDLPENKVAPVQHRLAYAGDTGMVVSWNTYQQLEAPWVQYGLSPDSLDQTAESLESITYPTSITWNNHVVIKDLQPDTTYYYKVANSENNSDIYKFVTAKSPGSPDEFSFSVVVDMGTMGELGLSEEVGKGAEGALEPGEQNTMQSLRNGMNEFEFLWHPGDIAYADYWLKEEIQHYLPNTTIADGYKVYEQILNAFYEELQPISAFKPYMVGPGNHEADCDNGGTSDKDNDIKYTNSICVPGQTNFTGFRNHFRMPGAESGGTGNFWYSFDYGQVHFVQFNTETDFGNGLAGPEDAAPNGPQGSYPNEQIDWLENDLASVNRTKTPWVIAAGHRPWYVVGEGCTDCKTAFESILNKHNVDLVVSGHVHNYERQKPISNGIIDPNGLNDPSAPWYIVNGLGGHYDGLDPLEYPLPNYTEVAQDSAYGWSKFTVHNCTHLTHEFVASANNSVLDRATLFKNRTCIVSSTNTTHTTNPEQSSLTNSSIHSTHMYTNVSTVIDSIDPKVLDTKTKSNVKVITITSCSNNICSEASVSATPVLTTTTIQGVENILTSYCPISNTGDNKTADTIISAPYSNSSISNASSISPLMVSSVGENSAAKIAAGGVIGFIILALAF